MSTELSNTNKNGNCANRVLSHAIVEALQNDTHLKELYKQLGEIHSKAFPIVVKVSPTEFRASYGDEFNELIANIHQEINFRQEQIVSFYNR